MKYIYIYIYIKILTVTGTNTLKLKVSAVRRLELEKIRKVAIKKGFVSEEDSLNLSDYQIGNYIFQPGFSSKETTTKVSGRGVGMDVVKMEVQKIGGNIIAESKEGKGVTITIDLPIFR